MPYSSSIRRASDMFPVTRMFHLFAGDTFHWFLNVPARAARLNASAGHSSARPRSASRRLRRGVSGSLRGWLRPIILLKMG